MKLILLLFAFLLVSPPVADAWEIRTVDGVVYFAKWRLGNLTIWADSHKASIVSQGLAKDSDFVSIKPPPEVVAIAESISRKWSSLTAEEAQVQIEAQLSE